jgi:hypothetical protein
MSAVQVNLNILNVGQKRVDRLCEGDFVVVGDKIGVVSDAGFCGGRPGYVSLDLTFHGNDGDVSTTNFVVSRAATYSVVEAAVVSSPVRVDVVM